MKRSLLIFFVIELIFSAHAHLTKRDDGQENARGLNSLMIRTKDMSMKVPLVGGLAGETIGKVINGYERLQSVTDGAIGRVLGRVFPCTFSQNSIVCSEDNIGRTATSMLKSFPDPMPIIPQFMKTMMYAVFELLHVPFINFMWGEMSIPEAIQSG